MGIILAWFVFNILRSLPEKHLYRNKK